jgi:hypothetical protein
MHDLSRVVEILLPKLAVPLPLYPSSRADNGLRNGDRSPVSPLGTSQKKTECRFIIATPGNADGRGSADCDRSGHFMQADTTTAFSGIVAGSKLDLALRRSSAEDYIVL